MSKQLSITVDTSDRDTLIVVGAMFNRLAGNCAGASAVAHRADSPAPQAAGYAGVADTGFNGVTDGPLAEEEELTAPWADLGREEEVRVVWPDAVLPPVVPPPPTLVVPPAPPASAAAGVDLDSRGLPWDRRIHASTKTKCATGEWKNARGIDKDLLAQVEAELRTAMASAPAQAYDPAFAEPSAKAGEPMQYAPANTMNSPGFMLYESQHEPPSLRTVPPAPPAPTPTAPPVASDVPTTFPDFLKIATAKVTAKLVSYQQITEVCQKHGLSGIPLLNARPDLIPTIYAELEGIWTSTAA